MGGRGTAAFPGRVDRILQSRGRVADGLDPGRDIRVCGSSHANILNEPRPLGRVTPDSPAGAGQPAVVSRWSRGLTPRIRLKAVLSAKALL